MEENPFLSILVVNLDYKMTRVKKSIDFIQSADTPLPVIRIFGSTDKGQRICANIHGVLPYIYMRPEGMTNTIFESEERVKQFLTGVEKSLEDLLNAKRMKAASNTKSLNGEPNRPFRRRRHVHALEIVYKKSIYGMYTEPHIFVKVVLRDPGDIVKIAAVLDETTLGGISMMTYESHIPYLLKFTSDYNVMPMGWLHLSQAKFRTPLPGDVPVFPPPILLSSSTPNEPSGNNDSHPIPQVVQSTEVLFTPNSDGQSGSQPRGRDTSTPGSKSTTVATPQLFLSPLVASQIVTSPLGGANNLFSTAVSPSVQLPGGAGSGVAGGSSGSTTDRPSSVPSLPKQQPGYFTQSTTPWQYIWGSTPPPPPRAAEVESERVIHETTATAPVTAAAAAADIPVPPHITEGEDIAALMEGITEETFVWSQLDNDGKLKSPYGGSSSSSSNRNGPGSNGADNLRPEVSVKSDDPLVDSDVKDITLLEKESCCELEVDVHISSILNIQMKKTEFGAELWEEERIRCAQLGLEMETVLSQPSTQTVHRDKQPVELQFIERYHSLVQKGEALRKVGGELIQSQSYPQHETLLRYLSMPDGNSSSSSSSEEPQKQVESEIQHRAATPVGGESASKSASSKANLNGTRGQEETSSQSSRIEPALSRSSSLNSQSRLSQESVDHWVSQRLKDLVESAKLDEELVQEFLSDPQGSVDSYVQSQREEEVREWHLSQQAEEVQMQQRRLSEGIAAAFNDDDEAMNLVVAQSSAFSHSLSSPRVGIVDSKNANENKDDDDEEEEGSDWATQCENNDILTSTQVDEGQDTSQSRRYTPWSSGGVASLKPVTATPEAVDIFPDTFFDEAPATPLAAVAPSGNSSSSSAGTVTAPSQEAARSSRPPLVPRRPSESASTLPIAGASGSRPSLSGRISPGYYNSASGSDSESDASVNTAPIIARKKSLDSHTSGESSTRSAPSPPTLVAASVNAVNHNGSRTPSPLQNSQQSDSRAIGGEEPSSEGERSDSGSVISYESILSTSGVKRKRPRQSVRFEDEVQVIRERKRRKSVSFDQTVSFIGEASVGANSAGTATAFSPLKGIAVSASSPIKPIAPAVVRHLPPKVLIEISSSEDDKRSTKIVPPVSPPAPIDVIEISSDDDESVVLVEQPRRTNAPVPLKSSTEGATTSRIGISNNNTSSRASRTAVDLTDHRIHDIDNTITTEPLLFPGDVVHQPLYYSNPNDANLVTKNSEAARMMLLRHPVGKKLNIDTDSLDNDLEVAVAEAKQKAETEKLLQSQINTPTQTPFTAAAVAPEQLSMKVGAGANVIKRSSRLTILSCEVHCNTRASYLPNPKHDEVQAIFWVVDDLISNSESETTKRLHGVICQVQPYAEPVKPMYARKGPSATGVMHTEDKPLTPETLENRIRQQKLLLASYGLPEDTYFHVVPNEQDVFISFINTIFNIDPDFLVGYEVQNGSLGYLVKRGKIIGIDMLQAMSKMFNEKPSFRNDMTDILDGHESGLFVTGRLILNMWQRMRDELKLFNYSYSNVTANLLEMRVPYFSHAQLTRWYRHYSSRGRTVRHLHKLAELNLILIEKIDLIRKTSEMARLYGIDFFSVLSRGSQYRVEASLLVKAHAHGYIMMSPSRQKVASQAPMECIPLVMEPISQFYEDPVVVLDYQSLYPSMMIAYNLCFTTIMGKLQKGTTGVIETTERLGASNYSEVQSAMCATLHSHASNHDIDHINAKTPYVSPNGSIFCSKQVRPGILPMMVKEMLETRQMIKRSMKRHKGKGSTVLQKVLDARQLAIKLLSNVTYGYTAAGFSGRMPMAELADAIVQSGRSTLEWTHNYINNHPQWRARVVYGDTDSVFVQLKGRTKDAAFKLGQEMSAEISAKCPGDVFLKFEKVYLPSILVTKKRYVGNMFETPSQVLPHLDAKGIEVVRRDQCPATVKMQEKCIRIMFECKDLSRVKEYLYAQWDKMLQGGDKLLLKDFIFSKEVRFGHYASVSSQPPGAIVATKAVLQDEMATPPYNWRVPYVVVHGVPNALLKHLVYSPEEVLRRGTSLRLNFTYYITKCINPALDRIMSLCGADVFAWFNAMPRPKLRLRHINYDSYHESTSGDANANNKPVFNAAGVAAAMTKARKKQTLMDQFTVQGNCTVCGNDSQPQKTLCVPCSNYPLKTLVTLMARLKTNTQREADMALVCHNCSRYAQLSKLYSKGDIIGPDCCESLDCQVFYERAKLVTRIEDLYTAVNEVEDTP